MVVPECSDVVISGIAGIFPQSGSIEELEQNLYNKNDLITIEEKKLITVAGSLDVPVPMGKLNTELKLDCQFFGIHYKLYLTMDQMQYLILKYSLEAVCDAGLNPSELSGTKTAVILSTCITESDVKNLFTVKRSNYVLLGNSKTTGPNRISYYLNLKGPSYASNSDWNGGLNCIEQAYHLIKRGECTAAFVAVCNKIDDQKISANFHCLGKLNFDGKTKCFSADADGYTRSEACVVMLLQRAEDARHSYGSVVSVLSRTYGFRNTSFVSYCPQQYKEVIESIYKDAKLDPADVSYIEADGSASRKEDAMELNVISEIFCKNRNTPLPIGSVKSNVGHTEASSSLVSLVKVLIALKTGIIPPNMHYSSPNPNVPALLSGQLQVITEPTPLKGDIVGLSSVGLAGAYGHIIIKRPTMKSELTKQPASNNIPWLFIISGREEESLLNVIKKVVAMPFSEEFVRLSQHVFKSNIKLHHIRGYALLNTKLTSSEVKPCVYAEKRPVWFLLSGMGSQWARMGADLMQLPVFAKTINICHEVLLPKGINLLEMIFSKDPHTYDVIINSFIGITAIQVGLLEVLKELGIEPDGIVGHSAGEVACAFADGCSTVAQTILSAYARGKASVEAVKIKGMMAAVGMGYNQIKNQIPASIEVACHNSDTSCTLSGPVEEMQNYTTLLKKQGVFIKLVNVSDIAFHSRYIQTAGPILMKYLKEIMPVAKPRSKRWISSSVPESAWDSDLAKFCSPEYFTNNLVNSVLFEEATAHIPEGAIVIEIAPHGLLQAIVKKSLPKCKNISLINKFEGNTLNCLFLALGKLYLEGISINIDQLYPKTNFPLHGNIPSLNSLITWSEMEPDTAFQVYAGGKNSEFIKMMDEQLNKYVSHQIGGRQYLTQAMAIFYIMKIYNFLMKLTVNSNPVIIKNLRFEEHCELLPKSNLNIAFQCSRGNGDFEEYIGSNVVTSGQINVVENYLHFNFKLEEEKKIVEEPSMTMNHEEIYEYFEGFSIEFNDNYKLIQNICIKENGLSATIQWKGELIEFLDALFMTISLDDTICCNQFRMIRSIRELYIDVPYFNSLGQTEIEVHYSKITRELVCKGIKMHLPLTEAPNENYKIPKLVKQSVKFLPYYKDSYGNVSDCLQILYQNLINRGDFSAKLTVILYEEDTKLYDTFLSELKRHCNNHQVEIIKSPSEDKLADIYFNLKMEDNLLIMGEPTSYKRILKSLRKVKTGFVLLNEQANIKEWNQMHPIFKFRLNDKVLTLYKPYGTAERICTNLIKMDESNSWKSELDLFFKNINLNSSNKLGALYLVGRMNSLSGIYKILRYCSNLENSDLIRFVFMDETSPAFSPVQPFYKKQLSLDLIVNISFNNEWGCLKLDSAADESTSHKINSKQKKLYRLSDIKGMNVTLFGLGMNLLDITECPDGQELGIFDYCGRDKSGRIICGIGTLSEDKELIEDDILCWQIPKNWSFDEAVSVPLSYTIAYYILCVKTVFKDPPLRILVQGGGSVVSQAIINVALAKGYTVFTTYNNIEEKNKIQQLFPKIRRDDIFDCNNQGYAIFLDATKGKGVNIVVNTSSNPSILKSSLSCVGRFGQIFQLNTKVMKNECTIGLITFLKDVAIHGIPSDIILGLLSKPTKEIIKKEIELGINQGHVKPLHTTIVPPTVLNVDAVNLLNSKTDGYFKRVVTRTAESSKAGVIENVFICSAQKSYIIISNENKFWVKLLCWLLKRGATHLHILTKEQDLRNAKSKRIISILKNYPLADIKLHSKKIMNSSTEMKKLFIALNNANEISQIFIIGKEIAKEVSSVDAIIRQLNYNDCCVTCIGSGGESYCESRCKNHLRALAISCQLDLISTSSVILSELDLRLKDSGQAVIFFEEVIPNRIGEGINPHRLPEDIRELLALQRKFVQKACFVETATLSPKYKQNKELDPIFIIPSLKPHDMDRLTSRLFYPAFEARLPMDGFTSIDMIAKDLYTDLKRFNLNVYTIISNDWGGAISLSLGKYLEDDGKIVFLIMLDSSPDSVQNWVSSMLQNGDINLINKYIKIPYKMKKMLSPVSGWEQKLDIALHNVVLDDTEREELRNGLSILRNCLLSIMEYNPADQLFQGRYFLYRPNGSNVEDDCNITKFCKMEPTIIVNNSKKQQDMLDDPELAKKINYVIPIEYKTAARKFTADKLGIIEYDFLEML